MDADEQGIRRVADVDWERWTVEERDTLLFVVKDGRVLLIRKKRGLGAGNALQPDIGELAMHRNCRPGR